MGIAVSEDHLALAGVVRDFAESMNCTQRRERSWRAPPTQRPEFGPTWRSSGGSGFICLRSTAARALALEELVVVVEELARHLCSGSLRPVLSSPSAADRDGRGCGDTSQAVAGTRIW